MIDNDNNNNNNNEMLLQILQTLNDFQIQTTASFNKLRAEIKESRRIENEHWLENLRRWDENKKLWEENNKRWEENDRRWEENNKRWEENNKRWEENDRRWEENDKLWKENQQNWVQYKIDRKKDHQEILDILIKYDISISTKLGDPNVDKMKKVLKM